MLKKRICHKMKKILLMSVILLSCSLLRADEDYNNKIAFITNGEVWVTDINCKSKIQVTNSGGVVTSFAFSPTLKYLAFNNIILNLADKTEIRLGSDMEGYSANVNKWFSAEKIIYELAGECDVGDVLLYNIEDKSQKSIYTGDAGSKYFEGTVSKDCSMLIYTQERFPAGLYCMDLSTENEKTILAEKSHYEGIQILNDNQYALMLSCKNYLGINAIDARAWELILLNLKTNESRVILSFINKWPYKLGYAFSNDGLSIGLVQKTDKGTDKIYTYNISKRSLEELAEIQLTEVDKYGFNRRYLSWSPDDKYIIVSTRENNKLNTAIVDCKNPAKIKYMNEMWSFVWVCNNNFLYKDKDVYLYDLASDKTSLFLKNATQIVMLQSTDKKK